MKNIDIKGLYDLKVPGITIAIYINKIKNNVNGRNRKLMNDEHRKAV